MSNLNEISREMNSLQEYYDYKQSLIGDIEQHMPTLKKYAEECDHIIEMGVGLVNSTYALLMGKPKKMISYDFQPQLVSHIKDLVKNDTDFEFIVADTRFIEIDETDLLFIDTAHDYRQLKIELAKHADKSKKYIILHDTTTFEFSDENDNQQPGIKGLWPAIEEFLTMNPRWVIHERYTNNNGLTILKRL